MGAPGDAIVGLVRDVARAVVDETLPAAVERLVPAILHQVKRALEDEKKTASATVYVTVRVAAEMMSIHPSTVRKLIADGKLGRYSVEGQLRVMVSDIHAYMAREGGPASPTIDLNQRALAILSDTKPRNDV